MSHIVTTEWKGNMKFESNNPSGNTFMIDTTPENGGNNEGLRPKAMMLSALAGCSGLDVVTILDKMKATVADFKMITKGELTTEHPMYYHTVTVEYHFYGKNLEPAKIEKAVNLSVEKYCGVMEMFRKFATVNTSIHYHDN